MRAHHFLLTLLVALAPLVPARADDWPGARGDRLEQALRDLERGRAPATLESPSARVELGHGDVTLVEDLARVDLTLEIVSRVDRDEAWQRTFEIDPQAEVVGASLRRGTASPIHARTLTVADARRIYGEVITPRAPRTPLPWRKDPLRVERTARGRLAVSVWPIGPGETVRVRLEFVTPLRGRGLRRDYRDVIQGDLGESAPGPGAPGAAPVVTEGDLLPAPALSFAVKTDWVVSPGSLELAAAPIGMKAAGRAAGKLRFVGAPGGPDRVPTIPFRAPRAPRAALAVPGAGLDAHVALWHFDPIDFLQSHGIEVPREATLRLLREAGSTSRIAPWTFGADGDPLPVTAKLMPESETLRYRVEVSLPSGEVVAVVPVEHPVFRERLGTAREGAITGWHRASLVRRVLDWADEDPEARTARAIDYAVDLGVLVQGTAALAVPRAELRRVSLRSRKQYHHDGAALGAPRREADLKWPPPGSMDEDAPAARINPGGGRR